MCALSPAATESSKVVRGNVWRFTGLLVEGQAFNPYSGIGYSRVFIVILVQLQTLCALSLVALKSIEDVWRCTGLMVEGQAFNLYSGTGYSRVFIVVRLLLQTLCALSLAAPKSYQDTRGNVLKFTVPLVELRG